MPRGLLKNKFLRCLPLLVCSIFYASEPVPTTQCTTSFSGTVPEIAVLKYDVLTKHFGPNKLFRLPFVQVQMDIKPKADELLAGILSELNAKRFNADTGLEAVQVLLQIDQLAQKLKLSHKAYVELVSATLPLQSSSAHQKIASTLLQALIEGRPEKLPPPNGFFTVDHVPEEAFIPSFTAGAIGYMVLGGALFGGPGMALSFAGMLLGPRHVSDYVRLKSWSSRKKRIASLNEDLILYSPELLRQNFNDKEGTRIFESTTVRTELEFGLQIKKLITAAEMELTTLKSLALEIKQIKGEQNFDSRINALTDRDRETEARNSFLMGLGSRALSDLKKVQSMCKTLKQFEPLKNSLTETVSSSKEFTLSSDQIATTEATALFQSFSGWLKKRESLTPVIILARGKALNSWIACSKQDFENVLELRNSLELYELNGKTLQMYTPTSSNVRVAKVPDSHALKRHASFKNLVLIPPELKASLPLDLTERRKMLRDFLFLQLFLNGGT